MCLDLCRLVLGRAIKSDFVGSFRNVPSRLIPFSAAQFLLVGCQFGCQLHSFRLRSADFQGAFNYGGLR